MTKFILKIKKWALLALKDSKVPLNTDHYMKGRRAPFPHKNADMAYLWNYTFRYGFLGGLKIKFYKKVLKLVSKYENRYKELPLNLEDTDEKVS